MNETLTVQEHRAQVSAGERFEFGKNWARFLETLTPEKIAKAEVSLRQGLHRESLAGLEFLDIGSGSGLFSLAARRLGAKVTSMDYDPYSVGCTQELRRRYFPDDPEWKVLSGSVLDASFMRSLGQFDIVYSWGVLHHTGSMWEALGNAAINVKPQGQLFIAIYNDQGTPSRRWTAVKKLYNCHPWLRTPLCVVCAVMLWGPPVIKASFKGGPMEPIRSYQKNRGMSVWHDVVDWVGGYPFEVATPEELFNFYRAKGFQLTYLTTNRGSMGCNELGFIHAGDLDHAG